ncbi:hypothetical protein SEMRO_754_G197480.1 [Seminavis robusta]|uniref:Uncharacterized protein n=1 Tax=Seminavis robusta TaxID=568900 RepID=A0A9N8E777_9STRA|nr:hypothetical protein SEMRO_754_G197480.1 [Seminavis robusta]|eukprot:Sro754_g197480.1 n/a (194) ;mRNA; f:5796-6668
MEKIGLVIANINGHLEIFESVSQLDQDTTTPSCQQRGQGMTTPNTTAAAGGRVVDLTSGNEVSDLSIAGSSGGSGGSGGQSTILAFLSNIEKNMTQRFDTLQNNQENHCQWCQQQFARVNNNQRRYGGTIGQAFVRGDPQEQARRRNHAAEFTGDGRVTRIIDRIIADGRDQRNPYVKAVGFRIDPQLCAEAI